MNRSPRSSGVLVPGVLVFGAGLLSLASACGSSASDPRAPGVAVVVAIPSATAASSAPEAPSSCVDAGPAPIGLGEVHQDLIAGPADTSVPVAKACEKIAQRLARAEKAGPGSKDGALSHVGVCFPSPKGAWALDPGAAGQADPDETAGGAGWEAPYTLTYVTPEGKLARSTALAGTVVSREHASSDVTVQAVFDFDGDGVTEIIVKQDDEAFGGEEHERTISLLTFRDGEVRPYAPAEGIVIESVVDMDGDGRPDLMTPGPFAVYGPCGYDGQTFRAPGHLAHSIPGGQFSLDDETAQAVIRAECGPLPTDLVAASHGKTDTYVDAQETAFRITCARIYGVSIDAASRRIRGRYPFSDLPKAETPLEATAPGYCLPLHDMLDLAAQKPFFTTRPPCPAK